jgi:hypothetical protein
MLATKNEELHIGNDSNQNEELHIGNDSNQNEDNHKFYNNTTEPQTDNGVLQEDQMEIKMRNLRQKELKLRK